MTSLLRRDVFSLKRDTLHDLAQRIERDAVFCVISEDTRRDLHWTLLSALEALASMDGVLGRRFEVSWAIHHRRLSVTCGGMALLESAYVLPPPNGERRKMG